MRILLNTTYELNKNLDTAIYIALILLAFSLLAIACLFYMGYWKDKAQYIEICDECEFDDKRECKYCGIHEHEKSLIK